MDSINPSAKSGAKPAIDKRIEQAARIKARLYEAGYKLSDIDRDFKLPPGTARDALRAPNLKGERAIASALGTRPELLWRDRYHASGRRKSPQDHSRPPTMAQRRKVTGALT
ncbi:helix-turn-helix domain-containing protein [Oricola indica]|uniref:helix-turn-helix domain-containing protein n=1 Tax=Oricola indica TaxID=2872591 RepID=UPI003CCBCF81